MKNRIEAVDGLRGIAAVGVVLFHNRHFVPIQSLVQPFPFESALIFFFKVGGLFVDTFFCISGFIFYRIYFDKIVDNRLSCRNFLIARIARLYPLILLTLFVSGFVQYLLLYLTGNFYLFDSNDYSSFFLNLFFLQAGFFKNSLGFNAPAWSLGIEFWLYILFFYITRYFKDKTYVPVFISLISFSALSNQLNIGMPPLTPDFERGVSSFFLGAVVSVVFDDIKNAKPFLSESIGFGSLLISTVGFFLYFDKLANGGKSIYFNNDVLAYTLFINPFLILGACFCSPFKLVLSVNPFKFLGRVSYSIYLWHFPIQLIIVFIFLKYDVKTSPELIYSFYVPYFSLILLVSWISTEHYEKPLKRYIIANLIDR